MVAYRKTNEISIPCDAPATSTKTTTATTPCPGRPSMRGKREFHEIFAHLPHTHTLISQPAFPTMHRTHSTLHTVLTNGSRSGAVRSGPGLNRMNWLNDRWIYDEVRRQLVFCLRLRNSRVNYIKNNTQGERRQQQRIRVIKTKVIQKSQRKRKYRWAREKESERVRVLNCYNSRPRAHTLLRTFTDLYR